MKNTTLYIKQIEDLGGTLPAATKKAMTALFEQDIFEKAEDHATVDLIFRAFKASLKEVADSVDESEKEMTDKLLEAVILDFEIAAEERKLEIGTEVTLSLVTDAIDEVEPLEGLTAEETIKVFHQVTLEFKNKTRIAEVLAFNAGVRG